MATAKVETIFTIGQSTFSLPPELLQILIIASPYIRDHSLVLKCFLESNPVNIKLPSDIYTIPILHILCGDISKITADIDFVRFTHACAYLLIDDIYIRNLFYRLRPFTCIFNMNPTALPAAYWCLYRCPYPLFGGFLLTLVGIRNYQFDLNINLPYHAFKHKIRSTLRCMHFRR